MFCMVMKNTQGDAMFCMVMKYTLGDAMFCKVIKYRLGNAMFCMAMKNTLGDTMFCMVMKYTLGDTMFCMVIKYTLGDTMFCMVMKNMLGDKYIALYGYEITLGDTIFCSVMKYTLEYTMFCMVMKNMLRDTMFCMVMKYTPWALPPREYNIQYKTLYNLYIIIQYSLCNQKVRNLKAEHFESYSSFSCCMHSSVYPVIGSSTTTNPIDFACQVQWFSILNWISPTLNKFSRSLFKITVLCVFSFQRKNIFFVPSAFILMIIKITPKTRFLGNFIVMINRI